MPIINVIMTHEDGGATKEQKEQLAKKLTQSFVEVFKRGDNSCVVTINEISSNNYSIGGKTVANIRKEK